MRNICGDYYEPRFADTETLIENTLKLLKSDHPSIYADLPSVTKITQAVALMGTIGSASLTN
jgi:hypothetical protein